MKLDDNASVVKVTECRRQQTMREGKFALCSLRIKQEQKVLPLAFVELNSVKERHLDAFGY